MGNGHPWAEMPCQEAGEQAQALIAHAMHAEVADRLTGGEKESFRQLQGGVLYQQSDFAMSASSFWFKTVNGVEFSYVLEEPVRAYIPDAALEEEFRLFLWGTVYGAIAWLNDLAPLHASAVTFDRASPHSPAKMPKALAFTGSSGAGKSTLAAGLCKHGARQLTDDTLVVVPCLDGVVALPDQKPLKLWANSLNMLGKPSATEMSGVSGKYFVEPDEKEPAPCLLSDLFFLEESPNVAISSVKGREKFNLAPDAFYRGIIHTERGDHKQHAQLMTQLAEKVRMWKLSRPLNAASFDADLAEIERQLRTHISGG